MNNLTQKIKVWFIINILVKFWEFSEKIRIEIANSPHQFQTIFHFRWKAYTEYGYIEPKDFPNKELRDEYDESSLNVIAFKKNIPIGAVRLILPSARDFPTEKAFNILNNLPRDKVGEISKLSIGKDCERKFRKKIFIILMSEIYRLSRRNKINYWLIGAPFSLVNYISKLNLHLSFQKLKTGPLKPENIEARKTAKKYFENYQITPFLINIQKL